MTREEAIVFETAFTLVVAVFAYWRTGDVTSTLWLAGLVATGGTLGIATGWWLKQNGYTISFGTNYP